MISLSDEQAQAVRAACLWHRDGAAGVFRLAGYAGSGKSTIIPNIVDDLGLDPERAVKNEVGHKDGDKINCHWRNLEWQTRSENNTHKNRVLLTHHNQRNFILNGPLGQVIKSYNLTETCEELGIKPEPLYAVLKGERSHHKGWKITRAAERLTIMTG